MGNEQDGLTGEEGLAGPWTGNDIGCSSTVTNRSILRVRELAESGGTEPGDGGRRKTGSSRWPANSRPITFSSSLVYFSLVQHLLLQLLFFFFFLEDIY